MTSFIAPIDITDKRDHLTALPAELLHLIFDYLLPNHEPDRALNSEAQAKSPFAKPHPIQVLSHTCRTLRGEVNGWAKSWLTAHRTITHYKELKSENPRTKHEQRGWLWGRAGLFKWMCKRCVFCGKSSSRRAIFANGFMCCRECDRKEWSEKITKSAAMHHYDLKLHHLFPHKHKPTNIEIHIKPLPRVAYGSYICANVPTTMFLLEDVKRLAEAVHGDLEQYKEKKILKKREKDKRKKDRVKAKAESEKRKDALRLGDEAMKEQAMRETPEAFQIVRMETLGTAHCPIDLSDVDAEVTMPGLIDLSADD